MKTNFLLILISCLLSLSLSADIEKIVEDVRLGVANEAVQVYAGKVGKLPAVFSTEWMEKFF